MGASTRQSASVSPRHRHASEKERLPSMTLRPLELPKIDEVIRFSCVDALRTVGCAQLLRPKADFGEMLGGRVVL